MAQCIVDDVAKGIDIWDCVAEIPFSRAHEETDPVSVFPCISGLASITAGDERETGDIPTVSADFLATGIERFADIIGLHFLPLTVMEILPMISLWNWFRRSDERLH
jgi:hypothetical protein